MSTRAREEKPCPTCGGEGVGLLLGAVLMICYTCWGEGTITVGGETDFTWEATDAPGHLEAKITRT